MSSCRLPEKCCECGQLIEYDDDTQLERGGLLLKPGFNTATWQGRSVRLTASEFETLRFIVKRDGLARKLAIYTQVFEREDGTPDPKIVDVVVCHVRHKLAEIGGDGLIATVWGQGYRLDPTNGSQPVSATKKRRTSVG